jgi:hypothetical protein
VPPGCLLVHVYRDRTRQVDLAFVGRYQHDTANRGVATGRGLGLAALDPVPVLGFGLYPDRPLVCDSAFMRSIATDAAKLEVRYRSDSEWSWSR